MLTRFGKSIKGTNRMAWLAAIGLILISCGSSNKADDPVPVLRQGQDLVIYSFDSSDIAPSMDAAGDRLAFISTRNNIARVYTVTIGANGLPSAPKALMEKDVQNKTVEDKGRPPESRVWLSPDGSYLLFVVDSLGVGSDEQKLYYANFDGTKVRQIKTGTNAPLGGTVSLVTFSDDSNLFALTNVSHGKRSTLVGGRDSDLVSPLPLTDDETKTGISEERSVAFFLEKKPADPYVLVSFTQSVTETRFVKSTFTDKNFADLKWSNLATSNKSLMLNEQVFARGMSQAFFINNRVTENLMVGANGNASVIKTNINEMTNDLRTPVKNWLSNLNFNNGAISNIDDSKRLGSDIFAISLSQIAENGVYVTREMHKCTVDGVDQATVWGQVLFFIDTTLNNKTKAKWLIPHSDANDSWTLASDPCQVPAGRQADFTIQSAQINAGASTNKYRVVYASQIGGRNSSLFILDQPEKSAARISRIK